MPNHDILKNSKESPCLQFDSAEPTISDDFLSVKILNIYTTKYYISVCICIIKV